jgi:hypothetical protein
MAVSAKKILIISPVPTHPPYSGNAQCILSYSEMLSALGYDLSFLWIADHDATIEEEELTGNFWDEKLYIFRLRQLHRIIKAFYRYFRFHRTGYYKVDDFYPFGIGRSIRKIRKIHKFDCVIVNYVFLSKLLNFFNDSSKIIYTHDVFSNKFQLTGNEWFSVNPGEEAKALKRADTVLAIQENEAVFFSYLTTGRVLSAFSYFPVHNSPFTGKKNILFMAGLNSHNTDAIQWFIKTVFNELILLHPEMKLLIGGSVCERITHLKKNDSIVLYNTVKNLSEFYCLGDIVINPTYAGTGLKIKSFEALAHGKVLISHPHNSVGIYKKNEAPVLLASDKEDYLYHINLLLSDPKKTAELKNKSIKYIVDLNEVVKSRFIEAIES